MKASGMSVCPRSPTAPPRDKAVPHLNSCASLPSIHLDKISGRQRNPNPQATLPPWLHHRINVLGARTPRPSVGQPSSPLELPVRLHASHFLVPRSPRSSTPCVSRPRPFRPPPLPIMVPGRQMLKTSLCLDVPPLSRLSRPRERSSSARNRATKPRRCPASSLDFARGGRQEPQRLSELLD